MNRKILVVVDVQRAYSPFFDEAYVEKVRSLVENGEWDDIIVRFVGEDEYSVQENGEDIHTFNADSRYIPSFLNKRDYRFSERWFGYEMDDENETIELVPDKLYKVKQNDEWWYMSETPNGDSYCPCRTIESLLEEDANIHIVGGFKDQCVKEVYDFLTFAGHTKVFVENDYCFETKKPNVPNSLVFTESWTEPQY